MLGNSGAQLSHVNLSNGAVDVQDEEYEFISGGQETNGSANGLGRSDRAVPSKLSSKAGIILVSLPSPPRICDSLLSSFQRVSTTSSLSFLNSSLPDLLLFYLP